MLPRSVASVSRSTSSCRLGTPVHACSWTASVSQSTQAPTLQRRRSSSKASVPPGGSRGSDAATDPASKGITIGATANDDAKTSAGRQGRRRSKNALRADTTAAAFKTKDDMFVNLPSVPPTSHLKQKDVHLSAFFSLHRPISITTSMPMPASRASFDSIFASPRRSAVDSVNFTVARAMAVLDRDLDADQEQHLDWRVLEPDIDEHNNPSRRLSPPSFIEDLLEQCTPFNVPPPPAIFHKQRSELVRKPRTAASAPQSKKQRTRQSLNLASPEKDAVRVRHLHPTNARKARSGQTLRRQAKPRVLARLQPHLSFGPRAGRTMWTISVKRQRKLKMKKHKYKKLMRRTRNLRRREGRN